MTSKRNLRDAIEYLKRQQALADKHTAGAWDRVHEQGRFLGNLLELDPSLERFRTDNGNSYRTWDVEGVKAAVEFRKQEAIAATYAPTAVRK